MNGVGCTPGSSGNIPRPWDIVFYTNSTVAYGEVTIDGEPASPGDEVGAFVSNECRGIGVVVDNSRNSIITMNIQGETVETVHFAVWDQSSDQVYNVSYSTQTSPGNDIGLPPDLLPIAVITNSRFSKTSLVRTAFPRPWNIVNYTNTTVAYGEVTIDGEPASPGDEVEHS